MAKLPTPKFNLRVPKASSETLISLVFRYNGRKLVYSTGCSIHPKDWNFKFQRPIQQQNRPDLFAIKREIEFIASSTTEIYISNDYGNLSIKYFREQLDIKLGKSPSQEDDQSCPTLLEFLDLELREMKENGMKHSSWDGFKRHVVVLKKFAQEVRDFNYEDIDWNFRYELIDWLNSRNIKLGYGNKTLSVLRQFLERARRKKLHSNIEYQGTGWMVTQKKALGEKVILTEEELQSLADLKLFNFADKVRDLFLIGAATGQRFSDYSKYQPENFYKTINNVPILSIISQKTDTPSKVPLNIFPWLIPILEKHNYTSPKMSMQKFNVTIKDICKKAGFDSQVFIVDQYIGRKAIVKKRYVPKYTQVSSHTCRRSFATNLYRMGYRLAQIMPLTGHATESQLREYIGLDNEMNAEEIAFSIMNRNKENKGSDNTGNLKIVNY